MTRRLLLFVFVGCVSMSITFPSAEGAKAKVAAGATGRQSVAAVRHDWKKSTTALRKLGGGFRLTGAVPKNFGRLSPETRLAYLHSRRALAPRRFDRNHPMLGRILARDDRARAALAQDCGAVNGILPDTAHWRYLQYRRSIAPHRFDFYHPILGALLAENQRLRESPICPPKIENPPIAGIIPNNPESPQELTPPGTPSPEGPIGGGPPTLSPVPEPASLTMLALGAAGAGIARLRAVRRSRREAIA